MLMSHLVHLIPAGYPAGKPTLSDVTSLLNRSTNKRTFDAPLARNAAAKALPKPLAPPVTKAVFPLSNAMAHQLQRFDLALLFASEVSFAARGPRGYTQ